jgi:hypothetical protein
LIHSFLKISFIIFACFWSQLLNAQSISGYVQDEDNIPVPFANVYIKHTNIGTVTDANGYYFIGIDQGDYEIIISCIGYKQKSVEVIVKTSPIIKNIWIASSSVELEEFVIKAKGRDPAYEIIQQAISFRNENNKSIEKSKCDVYIKAKEVISDKEIKKREKEKNNFKSKNDEDGIPKDPAKEHEMEILKLANSLNIFEIQLERSYQYPNKIKEVNVGYSKNGKSEGLFYLSTTEGTFNFYEPLLSPDNLNELPIISPLNPTSVLVYKFKLEKTNFEDGKKVYHIKITPRNKSGSNFEGYIDIVDESFAVKRIEMNLDKTSLLFYDHFKLFQEYSLLQDSLWVVTKQEFDYQTKIAKRDFVGNTKVIYSNYKFDVEFPKRYFNNELIKTTQDALDKDSTYWKSTRPEPLTKEEQKILFLKDSIKTAHNKKEYLDSIDRAYNRVTIADVLLLGVGNFNREKGRHIQTSGLASLINPFQLGGIAVGPDLFYFKKLKDEKNLTLFGNIHIGLRNKDIKGGGYARYLYNPFSQSNVYFSFGHNFDVVQSNNAFSSYFDRANYVEQTYIDIGHSQEILSVNGLYLDLFAELMNTAPIDKYKFGEISEDIIDNNKPRSFIAYQQFVTHVTMSYTPFQKYITEPKRKVVLGSKWPTLSVYYKKGFYDVLGSDINFDFMSVSMRQTFKVRTLGTSSYMLGSGKFLNTNKLTYEQYKIFPRSDRYFFSSPFENQLQDTTLIATDVYFEAHYIHHLNGAILNKIPLIKKSRIQASLGANYLFIHENKYHYVDFYFGVERAFRINRERFRFGLYFVYGGSSFTRAQPTLQFAINHYSKNEKSWGY